MRLGILLTLLVIFNSFAVMFLLFNSGSKLQETSRKSRLVGMLVDDPAAAPMVALFLSDAMALSFVAKEIVVFEGSKGRPQLTVGSVKCVLEDHFANDKLLWKSSSLHRTKSASAL